MESDKNLETLLFFADTRSNEFTYISYHTVGIYVGTFGTLQVLSALPPVEATNLLSDFNQDDNVQSCFFLNWLPVTI